MRQAVGGVLRIAQTEVVGLDAGVPFARRAAIAGLYEWQQPAARVTRLHIGIDRDRELMLGRFGPDAVERFIVIRIPLAPDSVADSRLGHQVAFVGGIDEHASAKDLAVLHCDFRKTPTLFLDGSQALLEIDGNLGFIEHLEEDVFRYMRLESPHSRVQGGQVAYPNTKRKTE